VPVTPGDGTSLAATFRACAGLQEVAVSEQTFRDALAEEEAAERALYNGDSEPYKAAWSHTDEVTLFGAFGPCKSGWGALSRTFDWVAHRYQGGTVTQEYQAIVEAGDWRTPVALEHGRVALDGGPERFQTIRVTQIYRREDGRWRLAHRHGDFAPLDESPQPSAKVPGDTVG
jgi:ketosteroid isomerase-like protein